MGRRLCDRYHVHSVIGTGGMGAVCRATDERLGRDVAVKVLTLAPADSDELEVLRKRFHREARAAAALRHPNVVTVHDFGTDPELGLDFLVMEYLPGEDVAGRIAREGGPLSVSEALEIWREAAMGVAAGHRAGLVHRDIKPRNVFLVSDPAGGWEVKVLDFGIAQMPAGGDTLAQLTRAVSPHTPRYAAPEQTRGDALTTACDVYSLSLTALEMLTGRYPEGVNTAADDTAASRWVSELNAMRPDLPAAVAAVLLKSLLRDPTRRFGDAGRLLAAIDRAMTKTGGLTNAGLTNAGLTGASVASSESEYTVVMPSPGRGPTSGPAPAPELATPLASAPRFSIPVPPPVAASPAAPAAAPGDGDDAGDTADAGAGKTRGKRPALAAWLLGLLLVGALGAAVATAIDRGGLGGGSDEQTRTEEDVAAATDPMRMWILAQEEAKRVGRQAEEGDTLWLVVAASLPEGMTGEAIRLRDRLADQGYPAGVANSRVYPELRDGYVVVIAGPYGDEDAATDARDRVRGSFAADAFLRRVTFQNPQPAE